MAKCFRAPGSRVWRFYPLLVLVGGLLSGTQIQAAQTEPTTVRKAPDSSIQSPEDPKICKRVIPTGSRIARRYCLPKSQWDAMREDGQRAAREAFATESQYGYQAPGVGS